ncbi:FAD dependent oxidoreductase [Gymnopus androsaceus JB14]|uniref:FAD dependent oxidoreductase n=1 Tax=Gymnopus androsaceus JB14 TaxID=1447944 RepID=A0A6A4HEB3_9AGAR|nr:FAD dependent oxidoreductase [Gymnopus androsaceus JB14]
MSDTQECDVLIVGSGFAGIHQLINLRKLGLTVKILESGGDLGGTWYHNTYPGCRVDSINPVYQFSDPELWRDWTWSERYPGWKELQEYFQYVDRKVGIKQDVLFNSRVVSAVWDDSVDRWMLTTDDGRVFRAQFLSLCTGIGSKHYVPDFKGLDTFKGQVHHTAKWSADCDLQGKKVGVIGTGATGVQLIQEIAPIVEHLTVFQRTPNYALPMRQQKINPEEDEKLKNDLYPVIFARRHQTFSGMYYDIDMKPTMSATPEERIIYYEDKWEKGGFHFWVGSYADLFFNQEANDEAYAFWRKKVRERIPDHPELQEKLAPMNPPHPFGVKRPCLEQRYFEVYTRPNVTLRWDPSTLRCLVLATGYDMVTGGITSIDIRGQDGVSIKEKWDEGVRTYLGLASATYPNMFWIYGPQSPCSFSNGPSTIELTSDWIIKCIRYMKDNRISSIVPTEEAQKAYSEQVDILGAAALWSKAQTSWYMASNVPGKKPQMLQFSGGVPAYAKLCNDSAENGYAGFDVKRFSA